MLIICYPSISSKAVLVSPQEHHGVIYPWWDPGINDTPLSFAVHQIVCSVAKEVNCNFVIGRQEPWAWSVVGTAL